MLRSRNGPGSFPAGRAGRRVPGRGGDGGCTAASDLRELRGAPRRLHINAAAAARRGGPRSPPPRSGPRPAPNRAARRRPWQPGPRGKGPPPPAPPKINPCHVTAAGQRAARGAAAGAGCCATGRSHPPFPPDGRPPSASGAAPVPHRQAGGEVCVRKVQALGARPTASRARLRTAHVSRKHAVRARLQAQGWGGCVPRPPVGLWPTPRSCAPPDPSRAGGGSGPSPPSGPFRAEVGAAPPPGVRPE